MPRSSCAVIKDVKIKQGREEYVKGMVLRRSCAVIEDVQIKPRKEEYV